MNGLTIEKTPAQAPETQAWLLRFSADWAGENSCFGYRANTEADLEGETAYLARLDGTPVGYLFGHMTRQSQNTVAVPGDAACFEVEELYVTPTCRSKGIGGALMRRLEEDLRGAADYLTLSTATKNWRSIFHFYIEELDMTFWNARLFKKL